MLDISHGLRNKRSSTRRNKMNKATFKNGDIYLDSFHQEDGQYWFLAQDKNGNEYETNETPVMRVKITLPENMLIVAA